MGFTVYNPVAIYETDLTTPTADINPTYVLGGVYTFKDSSYPNMVKSFMYVKSHTTLTQYQPYMIVFSNTSGSEVITAAPTTQASGVTIGVPQVAFTSGYYGFVQIEGRATALLANETHVAGDYLELLNAGTSFVVDGTSGSTAYTAKGVACQIGTLSGAGSTTVILGRSVGSSLISAS